MDELRTIALDSSQQVRSFGGNRLADPVGVTPESRDICYATQNRQTAVEELAHDVRS